MARETKAFDHCLKSRQGHLVSVPIPDALGDKERTVLKVSEGTALRFVTARVAYLYAEREYQDALFLLRKEGESNA